MKEEEMTKVQLIAELKKTKQLLCEKEQVSLSGPIVEDAVKRRLDFERVISRISSRFIGSFDLDQALLDSLADMGKLRKANRAYIFLMGDHIEEVPMKHTCEWHLDELSGETVQDFPVEIFPFWTEKLKKGQYVHIKSASRMPAEAGDEKEVLDNLGIKSILMYPLFIGSVFSGMIGFESTVRSLEWLEEDVEMLRVASEMLGRAIERKMQENELNLHRAHLEKLVESRTVTLRKLNEQLLREIKEREKAHQQREQYIVELKEAMGKIKTLRGLLPICSGCKKIRDDRGYWQMLEIYVRDHSEAQFSHGFCPECVKKLYPEVGEVDDLEF